MAFVLFNLAAVCRLYTSTDRFAPDPRLFIERMILMPETPQEPRHKFSALTTLAAVLATFLLAAAAYVCWQAAHLSLIHI